MMVKEIRSESGNCRVKLKCEVFSSLSFGYINVTTRVGLGDNVECWKIEQLIADSILCLFTFDSFKCLMRIEQARGREEEKIFLWFFNRKVFCGKMILTMEG